MNRVWVVRIGVSVTGGKLITISRQGEADESLTDNSNPGVPLALEMALNILHNLGHRAFSVMQDTGHITLDSVFLVVTEPRSD